MKNTFVIDERAILSPDVRKFITNIDWKFTDREIAIMIYNNPINSDIRNLNVLKNMIEEFDDESVITEINERVSLTNDYIEFIKASDDNCIFKLIPYLYEDELGFNNPNRHYPIIFSNFGDADKYAKLMKPKYGYDIIKSKICLSVDDAYKYRRYEDDYDVECDIGVMEFDSNHELTYCYINDEYNIFKDKYHNIFYGNSDNLFEEIEVLVPHPFKVGDILFNISSDDICILRVNDSLYLYRDDKEFLKRYDKVRDAGGFVGDIMPIETMGETGAFCHQHSMIQNLRYVKDDDYINNEEKEVYIRARLLTTGDRCYIQEFQMAIEDFISSNKRSKKG